MKVLGLDLDNSPLLMENKSLKYAENIEVDDKAQSYINEPCWFQTMGLYGEFFDNKTWTLVGSISVPNGFILFGLLDNQSAIIAYNQETNSIYKTYVGNLNFNIDHPITGVYTYKNEDLVIIFRDDINGIRILNIDSFKSGVHNEIDYDKLSLLELSPNLNNFNLDISIGSTQGSLLTGSYQIAVKFKTVFDNYTNYTTLSETLAIFEKNGKAIAPNKISDKSININLSLSEQFIYKACRFAIIHITDESQLAYETEDISITTSNLQYTVLNTVHYNKISLEDIFIKTTNYHNAKDLVIMNNQLILGNIEKLNSDLDLSGINVEINCEPLDLQTAIDNKLSFFQAGEIYLFYIGLFNRKGDLINIIPFEHQNESNCDIEILNIDNKEFKAHKIPYSISQLVLQYQTMFEGNTWIFNDPENNTEEIIYFRSYNGTIVDPTTVNISSITSDGTNLYYNHSLFHVYKRYYIYNSDTNRYDEINDTNAEKQFELRIAQNISLLNYFSYYESYTKKLPYNTYKTISAQAFNVTAKINIPDYLQTSIESIQLFYIKHTYSNSRILTSGISVPDTVINNFTKQEYKGQFSHEYNSGSYILNHDNNRFYSFDFLFNKINSINGGLGKIANIEFQKDSQLSESTYTPEYTPVYKWDDTNKKFTDTIDENGIKFANITITELENITIEPEISDDYTFNFILSNNSNQNNITGDSYHRSYREYAGRVLTEGIYNLYNTHYKYNSLNNQILQVASSIHLFNDQNLIKLKGDTYINYLTLRMTTPSEDYFFGNTQYPEKDSNKAVYRWIIQAPLMSKLNINAHYSTITNKVYNISQSLFPFNDKELIELIDLPYEVDHPINNDLDVNYSEAYNNPGIEPFIYGDDLNKDNHSPYRIVRSLYYNPEASGLSLLTFKSDDYKDLPAKYGKITVLNTNDNFLYVHQEKNLSYLSIRDTLGSDPNTGASYLSSSDLFNIEAKTLGFDTTGFISCNSKFDTHMNHSGYYVIDNKLHRIFKITKDSILDITSKNVSRYFKDNIQTLANNNPFKNQGRYLFYNNDNNTLYFVQQQNNLNISYKPIIDKWISFHTRHPLYVINNTHKVFDISSKYIYSPSNGYLGYREPSYIKIVFNQYPTYNKQFNVVSWLDRVTVVDLPKYNETISQIAICTDYQGTDFKSINKNQKWYDSTSGVKKINQWRFNEIWDVVKTTPFMNNPVTFIKSALNDKIKWYQKNKIVDQYCYVILKLNNTNSNKWELIDIGVEFDLDNRNKQYEDKKE